MLSKFIISVDLMNSYITIQLYSKFWCEKMDMIFNLSAQNSIANQFTAELRDKDIQVDRSKFRKNMKRLGQLMAYEISEKLNFTETVVTTPLGKSTICLPMK